MADRDILIDTMLRRAGWAGAARRPLAGDASNRRYLRLQQGADGPTAVLMDAPPERGEDVRPFLRIAHHLAALGLSAPRILAEDPRQGLLLLEDLGDALFARVVRDDPTLQEPLYAAATDLLAELHRHPPPPALVAYDTQAMTDTAALVFDWYLKGANGADSPQRDTSLAGLRALLHDHAGVHDVLVLRDYHAENLIWLPGRAGVARVGLLDFQDAMTGHRAYDLVSVLQDARRDVPPGIETAMIARYCRITGTDTASFEAAYHILGTQRNLRILGVFARLCLRDGKAQYIDLMPRVWGLLERDLRHPALAPIADLLHEALPPPAPDLCARLRGLCAR